MSNISIFQFETSEVRTVEDGGSVWFVATDIAKVLGYRNAPDMVRMLDEDEGSTHIVRTPSKNQHGDFDYDVEVSTISESGLYSCILKSERPEAKAFRKWLTAEVLPAIRKKGGYIAPTATPEQIEALRKDLDHAHFLLGEQEKEITELEVENKAFEDAARYSDAANELREAFRFSRALIANGEKYQVQGLIYKALYQEITAVWLNLVDRFVCRYCDDGGGRLHKGAKELLRNLHHSLEYHEWKAPACVKDAEKRLINFTDDLSPIAVILNHEPKANRRYMPKKPDCLK